MEDQYEMTHTHTHIYENRFKLQNFHFLFG